MSRGRNQKLKLLVVDDEKDNLDLLYRTFRRDFQVYKAESAIEALAVLEQNGEMGIIISDQRMPEMNGTEFLSKTVDRFPDTIRVLLTGYTDVEDLVDAGCVNTEIERERKRCEGGGDVEVLCISSICMRV